MSLSRRIGLAVTRLHVYLFRRTNGLIGGRWGKVEIALLTTTGRRSGLSRTTPVCCFPDGDHLVLVASNNGSDVSPAWFLNLSAHPKAVLQRGGSEYDVVARIASAEEKSALWPLIVDWYKGYARYQSKTRRDIPLVIVE